MKRRIGILLIILFISLGLVACGKDPYDEISMSLNKTEISLTLVEDPVTNEIVGMPETVVVEVQAPKDISKGIVLPTYGTGYGDEFVDITVESVAEGVYNLKITAKKQGHTEIRVTADEGSVFQIINVNIDISVNAISFKDDVITAVEIGGSLDLNSIGRSFIDYRPSYTSQTDVLYSLSNDMMANSDVVRWVTLQDNVLSIDSEAVFADTNFELELVATSKYNDAISTDDVLKVKIVTPINLAANNIGAELHYKDDTLTPQVVSIGKTFATADMLKYELVFASPYVDSGEVVDDKVVNHSMIFGGTLDLYMRKVSDYKIVYDGVQTDVADVFATSVDTTYTYDAAFEIQAKEAGTYVAKFRIEYTGGTDNGQFDGQFTKHIEVTINVINLPTAKNILINGKEYKNGNNVVAIYDYYVGIQGSEFTVSSDMCTNLEYQLGVLGDELVWNSSVIGFDVNSIPVNTSTKYSNKQILYLKNGTSETLTTTLNLTVYCNVYNDSYLDDETKIDEIRALQTYKKDIVIKLNLISGLESIDFDADTMADGFKLNVVADTEGKVFYSFNEGVVAESVISSINYNDTRLFTYGFEDNHIILYPNTEFLEGDTLVSITLTNGVKSGDGSPTVKVEIPYEGNNVITQINTNNGGFFAFGSIKDANVVTLAGGEVSTEYNENFDSDDIANGTSDKYSRESGKKTITASDDKLYTFDGFDNIVVSTWSEIEFDFYRLLVIDGAIKYTNKNTLKIVSSDQSMLYWANGYLFVSGATTYNNADKKHYPLTISLRTANDVELHTIKVYIVNRIESVQLSQSIFPQYVENRLASAVLVDNSRDLLEIIISRLDNDDRTKTIIDDDIKAGTYGNIYTEYRLLDANEVVFWFTNPNTGDRVEILKKDIVLEFPENVGSGNGGYLKLLKARIDKDVQSYPGGEEQLYVEIFGSNGINFEYAGIVKQFDQEIPVLFTVNVKNPVSTQSVTTNLDKETGIYFEADESNNKYSFNYVVYPVNASFRTIFVQIREVVDGGASDADVKIAVSYTKSNNEFINYKIYESGNFDPTVYYSGAYEAQDDGLAAKLNACDFVVQIYGGKVTIIQKSAASGTYIISLARLDMLYFEDDVWDWSDVDPSTVVWGPRVDPTKGNLSDPMASIGFHGIANATYNLTIADGESESTAFQIRTVSDLLAFMQTSQTNKYYVIANDIYLNRKFSNSGGYIYNNYIKQVKNNLSGRFVKYLKDKDGNTYAESYNRAIYGFTVELTNISENINVGLFSSVAEDVTLKYVSLGNIKIDVTTTAAVDVNVGGLVGELNSENVNIIGAKAQGNININAVDGSVVNIGGLVGKSEGSSISINTIPDETISVNNSDINANVAIQFIGKNANIGGVVGYVDSTEINDVRAVPSIFSKESADGDYSASNIGGIAGHAVNANINDVIVYPTLVGHTNVGGIVGLLEGGKISYAQAQMLYNVNMKTVIAGYNNVGGIVGKIYSNNSAQTSSLNYTYVRSYTTKEVKNYDTSRLEVKKFHSLYANNYYGAVVLLPSTIENASIGGLVAVSDATTGNKDTLSVDYSYFMSHLISFNHSAGLGMAGIVGRFTAADNKMVITNSYIDGALKTVYADANGDTINELCMNFLTSTVDTAERSDLGIISSVGGTTSTNYSIKGTLNDNINSYVLITQENVVSNVIVSYRTVYPNVVSANSNYLYARINNSLFGIAPIVKYQRDIDPTGVTPGTEEVSAFEYSGYTTTTTRTTALIANIQTAVGDNAIALFAKKEIYESTPSGNFYKPYTLASGTSLQTSQMAYLSEELASVFLQQQFYELNGASGDQILPKYFASSETSVSLGSDSGYSDIAQVLKTFSAIQPVTISADAEEAVGQIYEVINEKTTSVIYNADNDNLVYLTRVVENSGTISIGVDGSTITMSGEFNTYNIVKQEDLNMDGLDDVYKYGYTYSSSGSITTISGSQMVELAVEAKNGRRFIMITGVPKLLGADKLLPNQWLNDNETHVYSRENIDAIFFANGKIYGRNLKDGCIYDLVVSDDPTAATTFTFIVSNGGGTTEYSGYVWGSEKIDKYKKVGSGSADPYYYFENSPKLIYISTNSEDFAEAESPEKYKYEFDNAGIVNIHNNNYTLSYGQLVDVETEMPYSEAGYHYGVNSEMTIDAASTALTNSRICSLYAEIDKYTGDFDIDYNDLDHLFKQHNFSNFNGEKYTVDIAYTLQGTAYYNSDDNYWYYDEEFSNLIKEDSIVYTDASGNLKYIEYQDIYYDVDHSKWIYFDQGGTAQDVTDFSNVIQDDRVPTFTHYQPVYRNYLDPNDKNWYYDNGAYLQAVPATAVVDSVEDGVFVSQTNTIRVMFDGAKWVRSHNTSQAIVDIGTTYEIMTVSLTGGTYTLDKSGKWYDEHGTLVEDARLLELNGQTTYLTQEYKDVRVNGASEYYFYVDEFTTPTEEIPDYLEHRDDRDAMYATRLIGKGDAYESNGRFYKADGTEITKYLLLTDNQIVDGELSATYSHTFYRRGEWFTDEALENDYTDLNPSDLPEFTQDTEYIAEKNKYGALMTDTKLYYSYGWYYDSEYNKEMSKDLNSFNELYGATEYFYKSNTYYKLTGWYYDDEAKRPVNDTQELAKINKWLQENGTTYTEFSYYGVDYYKRHNWFEDEKCITLVSNDLIVEILNVKFDDVDDGAYVLNQWFKDDAYSIPISDEEAVTLGTNYESLKLQEFQFVYYGETYELSIIGNTIKINGDSPEDCYESMFGYDGSQILGILSTAQIKIMIDNNILRFVSIYEPEGYESIIQINGYDHYVLATVTVQPKDNYTWLTTYKVNDGVPTLVTPIVNVNLVYDGANYTTTTTVNYELFYDELATFSIYAQPFEKAGEHFITSDNGEGHSAHIKKDDNSVVLMYNYSNAAPDMEGVNRYKISFGERLDGYYFAQLNGMVVDLSAIEIDKQNAMQLKITSSDKGVVDVVKADNDNIFYAQVNGEGSTVVTFYNLKDDSIKVSLNITVIKGFTDFSIYDDNKNIKSELEAYVGSSPTYYNIGFVNKINGIEYQANQGGFYVEVISIDGKVNEFDANIKYSSITLGSHVITKDHIGQSFEFTSANISIQGNNCYVPAGKNAGVVAIKITPYVICDGEKLAISDMSKNTYVYVYSSAQSISFTERDATIIADGEKEITVIVYSNKSDESVYVRINGKDIFWKNLDAEDKELVLDLTKTGEYLYTDVDSLLNIRLKSAQHVSDDIGDTLMYTHTFVFVLSMNSDQYRQKTSATGMNAIAESAYYEITVIPQTNTALSAKFDFEIAPLTANRLDAYLYPEVMDKTGSSAATEKHYYVNDFTAQPTLVPSSDALFKFVVNPIYSNILALELKVDPRYVGYIKFQQVIPAYENEISGSYNYISIKKGNVQIGNVYTLWDIPYQDGYFNSSNTWTPTDYIFGEYFLMMTISENMPQGITIPFELIGYDYQRRVIISKTLDVYVEHLPSLDITIGGERSAVYGFDEYAALEISGRNAGEVTIQLGGLTLFKKEDGNYVSAGVGTDIVIDLNTQYYVYTGMDPKRVSITIATDQTIHGKNYQATASATLQVVYVTIERVRELNAINDIVTMETGEYLGLEAVVETNKLDKVEDCSFTVKGETLAAYIDNIEKQISGHTDTYEDNNFWQYFNGESYEQLSESKSYPGFSFSRHKDISIATLFRVNAIQISRPTLRLSFSYYYYHNPDNASDTNNGTIVIGQMPEHGEELFVYDYVFDVNIKDGSTEDTPVPIFSIDEFMNMQDGVNYILLTDLTLANWKPMEFNAAYLDGNGFTITINSFDLSEIKGTQTAQYVGVFKTINAGCMVKNLNINVSPLLYSDAKLSKAINETETPNIDLRLTKEVYFGVLAGRNQGTVINVKIINTDGRKTGQTLYVATTRGYFQINGQTTTSSGRVAGMTAINEGVIINSFIGVNEDAQIKTTNKNNGNSLGSKIITLSPFALAGANNVAGFVTTNSGTITNCYVKNLNITNTTRISSASATGGFVVDNSGEIHSSAISSKNISKFRATDVVITSAAITGGFAYTNSGEIQDAYTTAQMYNNNVQTAGFVFKNTGTIKNTYTTSKNTVIDDNGGNTGSHALFVGDKSDYGTLENCYYLVRDGELGSKLTGSGADKINIFKSLDPAIPIQLNGEDVVTDAHFTGFNFITVQDTYDGTWTIKSGADGNMAGVFPQLEFAENLTYYSRRELADIQATIFNVVDSGNIDIVTPEGAIVETLATTSEDRTIIFEFEGSIFQIDASINTANDPDTVKIDKITDISTSTEMAFDSGSTESKKIFTYAKHPGYDFTLEGTYDGSKCSYEFVTTNRNVDPAVETKYSVTNYEFTYGINFVLAKLTTVASPAVTTYQMFKVDAYATVKLQGQDDTFKYGGNTSYKYSYAENNMGSLYNPIVITNAAEFSKYIVTHTNEYYANAAKTEKAYIFGLVANNGNGVNSRYVQIASDIDFSSDSIDSKYEVSNSTDGAEIGVGQVIFNGVLLGNAMSLTNVNKVSYEVRENYGIFNTIGLTDEMRYIIAEQNNVLLSEICTAVVFDLDIKYNQFANRSANKVGVLAGTITNAVVSKIDISGVETTEVELVEIAGNNLVGALAGLIIGEGSTTKVSEITVNNVVVTASHNKIQNLEIGYNPDTTQYNSFKNSDDTTTSYTELTLGSKTVSYRGDTYTVRTISNLSDLSYAGGVAGAVITDSEINEDITKTTSTVDTYKSYSTLREVSAFAQISDMKVSGSVNIKADFAGGVLGYAGGYYNETRTVESNSYKRINYLDNFKLELSNNADSYQNINGYAYAGGIVGQTKDVYITKAIVSYNDAIQATIDANINKNKSTDISSSTLFASSHMNVGIGGIAGYTTDTWIVDSVSKANVENNVALMAGGIIGRADDEAYLAYVYTTGNVLGRNMIGGLIGYYLYDNTGFNLKMNNAFATNVWSKDIKNLLKTNEETYTIYVHTGTSGFDVNNDETIESGETNAWVKITSFTNDIDKNNPGSKTKFKQATGIDIDAVIACGINTMPELGNQVVGGSEVATEKYKITILGHEFAVSFNKNKGFTGDKQYTYIGSVLGRSTSFDTTPGASNSDKLADIDFILPTASFTGGTVNSVLSERTTISGTTITEDYFMYYNENFFNVISSTYGAVRHSGTIEQGNYTSVIDGDKLNLSYFKTNYDDSVTVIYNGTVWTYNSQAIKSAIVNAAITAAYAGTPASETEYTITSNSLLVRQIMIDLGYSDYDNVDISTYKQIFGKQEYISYITGDFVNKSINNKALGNKVYPNEFNRYYSFPYVLGDSLDAYSDVTDLASDIEDDTTDKMTFSNQIINKGNLDASTVWYVDVSKYVAQYGYNIGGSFNIVAGEQALFEAFTYGESNKLYKLSKTTDEKAETKTHVKNEFDLYNPKVLVDGQTGNDSNNDNYMTDTKWYAPTKIGVNNNIYFAEESNSVTIKFKLTGKSDGGKFRYGLFDSLVGCTFININFIIDISAIDKTIYTNSTERHLGLFANSVNGCSFTNCSFEFKYSDAKELTIEEGQDGDVTYAAKDFGMVFGLVENSTISGTNFNFDSNLTIKYEDDNDVTRNLYQYGLIVAQMTQTTFMDININQNRTVGIAYSVVKNSEGDIISGTEGSIEWYDQAPEFNQDEFKWETKGTKITDEKILAQLPITGVKTRDSCVFVTTSPKTAVEFKFEYKGQTTSVTNASSYNFGGLVGLASSARIENVNYTASKTTISLDDLQATANSNKINTLNIGGLIGQSQSSLTISGINYDSQLIIGTAAEDSVVNINAGVIGQLNTTNVSNMKVVKAIAITAQNKTLNAGLFGLGSGAGNTISDITNEADITVTAKYDSTNYMLDANIGIITGKEEYGSIYNNIVNDGDLTVDTNTGVNSLNVGGFVGYTHRGGDFETCYNIGNITIEPKIATAGGSGKNKNTVNVGGLVGKNNNQKAVSMTGVINYGDIYYEDCNNENYFIAGLVGHNSGKELNLTSTLSLGNFIRTDDYSYNYFAPTYKNSKVYSRINAMANNVGKNSKWNSSYYISEHDPVASQDASSGMYYATGNTLENFMVSAGMTYTRFVSTTKASFTSDGLIAHDSTAITSKLPYVEGLETSYITTKATAGSKFNPTYTTELSRDIVNAVANKYIVLGGTATVEPVSEGEKFYGSANAITAGTTGNNIEYIAPGQVITCADTTGATRYYLKYTDSNTPFIDINKGTISNILFVIDFDAITGKNYDGLTVNNTGHDALLMNTNYGYIMNIGVTQHNENGIQLTVGDGAMDQSLSVVKNNNGGIFTSGTSIQFTNTTSIPYAFSIGYFVGNNANVMVNCYTTSALNAVENTAYYSGNNWCYDSAYANTIANTSITSKLSTDSLKSSGSLAHDGTTYYYNAAKDTAADRWYTDSSLTTKVTDSAIITALENKDTSIKRGATETYGAPVTFGALAINNGGYIGTSIYGGNFVIPDEGQISEEKDIVGIKSYLAVNGKVDKCYVDKSQSSQGDSLSKFFGVKDGNNEYTTKPLGAIRIISGASTDIVNYYTNFSTQGEFKNNSVFWTIDRDVTINKGYPYIYGGIKLQHVYSDMDEVYIYTTRELDNFLTYYASKENKSNVIIEIDTSKAGEIVTIINSMSINSGDITGSILSTKDIEFSKGFIHTNKGKINNLTLQKCKMTEYFISTNDSGAEITNLTFDQVSLASTTKFVGTNNGTLTINKLHGKSGNYLNIDTNSGNIAFTSGADDIIKNYNVTITSNSGMVDGISAVVTALGTDKYHIVDGSFKFKFNTGTITNLRLSGSSFEAIALESGANNDVESGTATISNITLDKGSNKNVFFGSNGANGVIKDISMAKQKLTSNLITVNDGKFESNITVSECTLMDALVGTNNLTVNVTLTMSGTTVKGGNSAFINTNNGTVDGTATFNNTDISLEGDTKTDKWGVGMAIGNNKSYKANTGFTVTTDSDCSITVKKYSLVEGVGMAIGMNTGPSDNSAPVFNCVMKLQGSMTVTTSDTTRSIGGAIGESGSFGQGWPGTYKQQLKLGSDSSVSITMTVGEQGDIDAIGGVVGLLRGTSMHADAAPTISSSVTIKGINTSSDYIGGFAGYADISTCSINFTADTNIAVPITLSSNANASNVGGILGNSSGDLGTGTTYYSAGITTKLIYTQTINCTGLSTTAITYDGDWWTSDNGKSFKDILNNDTANENGKDIGNEQGDEFVWTGQWRYMMILRGCEIKVGLVYGTGSKPANCSANNDSKLTKLSNFDMECIILHTYHATKKTGDGTYLATKWENDQATILRAIDYDINFVDSDTTGEKDFYDHVQFATQTNYKFDLWTQDTMTTVHNDAFKLQNWEKLSPNYEFQFSKSSYGSNTEIKGDNSVMIWYGGKGSDSEDNVWKKHGGAGSIVFKPKSQKWDAGS